MMISNLDTLSTNVKSTLNQIKKQGLSGKSNFKKISECRILSNILKDNSLLKLLTSDDILKINSYLYDLKKSNVIIQCTKRDSSVFIGGSNTDYLTEESIIKDYINSGLSLERKTVKWHDVEVDSRYIKVDYEHRNINVVGSDHFVDGNLNFIHGLVIVNDIVDGVEINIRNSRGSDLTIVNRSIDDGSPFVLYTNENYKLKKDAVITFKYVKKDNNFVATGLLKAIISKEDIDGAIGQKDRFTLFIDSSKGDSIDASDMSTTLTAYVDEYFNDVTDSVTSWQWFRESGKTQEAIDSDEIWKIGKNERSVYLKSVDFTDRIYEQGIVFTCEAVIDEFKLVTKTTIG